MSTSTYISDMLGDATIEVETKSQETFSMFANRKSISLNKRRLKLPEEVLQKPKKNSYVLLSGLKPIMATKMDYTSHEMGDKVKEHFIYDMLKQWSKKYHEPYLTDLSEQLKKAINVFDNVNELNHEEMSKALNKEFITELSNLQSDSDRVEVRSIYDIGKEVSAQLTNSLLNTLKEVKEKSKMEKTLDVIEEKLRKLKAEKLEGELGIGEKLRTYSEKIKEDTVTLEKLQEYSDELHKIENESEISKENKSLLGELKSLIVDRFREVKENNNKNIYENLKSEIDLIESSLMQGNLKESLTNYRNINRDKLSDKHNKLLNGILDEMIKQSDSIIKDMLNRGEFDSAKELISELLKLNISELHKDKVNKLYDYYNEVSEKAYKKSLENTNTSNNKTLNIEKSKLEEIQKDLPCNEDEKLPVVDDVENNGLPFDDTSENNGLPFDHTSENNGLPFNDTEDNGLPFDDNSEDNGLPFDDNSEDNGLPFNDNSKKEIKSKSKNTINMKKENTSEKPLKCDVDKEKEKREKFSESTKKSVYNNKIGNKKNIKNDVKTKNNEIRTETRTETRTEINSEKIEKIEESKEKMHFDF